MSNGDDVIVDGDTPIFVDGIACWAREARFGGVVVQPPAAWLKQPSTIEEKGSPKTLAAFRYDGRAVLDFLIAASPWGSIDQAIASLSLFAHPDVVAATGRRAVFRTVRGRTSDRGTITDGVMVADNASLATAFEWSTGFKRAAGSDLTCCRLYVLTAPLLTREKSASRQFGGRRAATKTGCFRPVRFRGGNASKRTSVIDDEAFRLPSRFHRPHRMRTWD